MLKKGATNNVVAVKSLKGTYNSYDVSVAISYLTTMQGYL